jgi:integrase/recombinase XerD
MAVLVDAIQWTYSQRKDGTSPIKLRVQYESVSKYFPIHHQGKSLSLSPEDWADIISGKVKGKQRKILERVREEESRAREIVDKITLKGKRPFSYGRFSAEYDQGSNDLSFFTRYERYLDALMAEKRIGSYNAYNNARVAFGDFLGRDIEIHEITPQLLKRFEGYLLNERKVGKKKKRPLGRNTVGMYMRSLKVIYNVAVADNPYLSEFYPFARKRNETCKYQIRTGSGKKGDALTLEQLQKFVSLEPSEGSPEWVAKMYWMFSFYCQGMNFRDMAYLKPCVNLKEAAIVYTRRKTLFTERDEAPITVPLNDSIRQILSLLNCNVLDER